MPEPQLGKLRSFGGGSGSDLGERSDPGSVGPGCFHRGSPLFPARSGALVVQRRARLQWCSSPLRMGCRSLVRTAPPHAEPAWCSRGWRSLTSPVERHRRALRDHPRTGIVSVTTSAARDERTDLGVRENAVVAGGLSREHVPVRCRLQAGPCRRALARALYRERGAVRSLGRPLEELGEVLAYRHGGGLPFAAPDSRASRR
jgi:hypothetical protein